MSMGTDRWPLTAPPERYQVIAVADDHWVEVAWQPTIVAAAPELITPALTYTFGVVGPGWALLALRLARRLRRAGYPPNQMPRLVTIGAGEMSFALPVRAPHRVHRVAAAVSRLALGRCEICLRAPVSTVSLEVRDQQDTLRLCTWHRERLQAIQVSRRLREEAWDLARYGVGALRAMLLGGRLSSSGVEAALREFGKRGPAALGAIGWVPPDLLVHALARLSSATLAGVSVEALLPLLSDDDEAVRRAAVLATAQVRDDSADAVREERAS